MRKREIETTHPWEETSKEKLATKITNSNDGDDDGDDDDDDDGGPL